ncbi:uncharacterized protein N7469_009479 [Penicillium citrinum]|uniref:Uncharacterized protein n=1 Tax=Penicillium citrinum TaxID=5077 RepID=A0A9W9TF66_PENCI|nr:uncharacterized protein N7469_009479 [Penicillium citrinum]KAJ5220592.1 hypothetical protein N7469_009479 [Penicillium citrinum]
MKKALIQLDNRQDGLAITGHPGSRTTSFISFDDHVNEKDILKRGEFGPKVLKISKWSRAVEGLLDKGKTFFAIVGVSITDAE